VGDENYNNSYVLKQGSDYGKGSERSEHSSLDDFGESDDVISPDSSTDGNLDLETTLGFLQKIK